MTRILPGATIGILGGGQLGRMLALAGIPLGLRFRVLEPAREARRCVVLQRQGGCTVDRQDHLALCQ